uniref:Ubiquitin carboxyl-terminal hydrolase n=1 Tax=Sparus aurata TaxID=8175 RepID=A0A671VVE9_SPAAU
RHTCTEPSMTYSKSSSRYKAVDLNSVKKSVLSSVWLMCSECLKERTMIDGEPAASHDIVVCLKCGFQGCNQSGIQHAVKHHQAFHPESHCITISLSTWKAWCFECNEELSTHCNKKALAQTLDFLQKHSVKATSGAAPKIIKLQEEPSDYTDLPKGKSPAINSTLVPVKGINNLGNTCFFNAVMQNLSQTHMLIDLIQEVKEKGYKLRICPPVETNLSPLTVMLPSPEPLTAAMFLFLQSMKEPGKGPINPKVLFNQLCQKAPRFKGYQQQDSQELLHYLMDSIRVEETKRVKAGILKAFNNPTEKTADEDTKRQVKAYGKEGVRMNFVDRIFVGELTNTIMCEECEHISTVKEAFIDISLPIIEERVRYYRSRQGGAVEQLVTAVSKVNLGFTSGDFSHCSQEEQGETQSRDNLHHQHHQGAFQALSHSYTPSSKECSIQSCLHQFTSVELLMGNNKLLCECCTERRQKQLRKSSSSDKKLEKIYTSARKQMLISSLPPVITLHLKRFHQAGMNLRKVNRHVDFPLILDLAPFCSASCKNLAAGERVLYSLYGIVEHSGSMRGGHYTAYVKVRAPQKKVSEKVSGRKMVLVDASSSSQGQWVYISDTTVQTVPESRVLNSQAYLLFYEEML